MERYTAEGGQQWVAKYVWLKHNNYVFRFAVGDGDPNGDYRSDKEAQVTFNQMFSTFTFTDQNRSISVNPEGKACGRLAGETGQFACPTGYVCQYPNPMYPDAQGKYVRK